MREYEHRFERIIACCYSAADATLYRGVLDGIAPWADALSGRVRLDFARIGRIW